MEKHKKIKILSFLVTLVFIGVATFLTMPLSLAGKGPGSGVSSLNQIEIDHLEYMREEEKLARDVYLVMTDLWQTNPFARIAVSEQQHMDTMKAKLDKYGLPDSASIYEGVFNNTILQQKYDELIEAGAESLTDGLTVGATIEEIDMVDIQHAIADTDNLDVVVAYQNLLEGSKNHLRAYVNALARQGVTYTPQYISQALFEAIMGV
ncbi:MAG: hypothetical protein C0616_02785 [Desulfuromonas sp.]|nr:MAG: hypothetical protein C0616_02785 [Desulfuromonas sp.]